MSLELIKLMFRIKLDSKERNFNVIDQL